MEVSRNMTNNHDSTTNDIMEFLKEHMVMNEEISNYYSYYNMLILYGFDLANSSIQKYVMYIINFENNYNTRYVLFEKIINKN